jgi:hypothetical protein
VLAALRARSSALGRPRVSSGAPGVIGIPLRRRTRFLRSTLHFGLAAKDRAPVLMFGHWHAALDADAHARFWRLVSTQQSFQK